MQQSQSRFSLPSEEDLGVCGNTDKEETDGQIVVLHSVKEEIHRKTKRDTHRREDYGLIFS